jgi:hypothetical protein
VQQGIGQKANYSKVLRARLVDIGEELKNYIAKFLLHISHFGVVDALSLY